MVLILLPPPPLPPFSPVSDMNTNTYSGHAFRVRTPAGALLMEYKVQLSFNNETCCFTLFAFLSPRACHHPCLPIFDHMFITCAAGSSSGEEELRLSGRDGESESLRQPGDRHSSLGQRARRGVRGFGPRPLKTVLTRQQKQGLVVRQVSGRGCCDGCDGCVCFRVSCGNG